MADLLARASTDTTGEEQETHDGAAQPRAELVSHNNDTTENNQQNHEQMSLLQPQSDPIDHSHSAANPVPNESASLQSQETSYFTTPPLNPRRDNQEATVSDHGNVSQLLRSEERRVGKECA